MIPEFRAWDKGNKVMLEDVGVQTQRLFSKEGHPFIPTDKINMVVMQWTGLLDVNGNKIFEGDILKYFDSTGMWLTGIVKNVGSCFAIMTDENPIPLYSWVKNYTYNGDRIKGLVRIGNKFENANLLEG